MTIYLIGCLLSFIACIIAIYIEGSFQVKDLFYCAIFTIMSYGGFIFIIVAGIACFFEKYPEYLPSGDTYIWKRNK